MDYKEQSNKSMSFKQYFAAREEKECAASLLTKAENWSKSLRANGYNNKLRDLYSAYHGAYFNHVGEAHQLSFGGDDGELVETAVNHLRNIARHMLTMTTSTRPAMECKSINTDLKSQIQTYLGNGLLEYYIREKRLEEYFEQACEYSLITAIGWIKMSWNAMLGEQINRKEIEEIQTRISNGELNPDGSMPEIPGPEYEGDVEFECLSGLDVIMDLSKESSHHDWLLCRSFKNRYDLIAKYPEKEKEIMAIESKDRIDRVKLGFNANDETDDIPIYEFYHRRSESLPDGRYMMFVSTEAILYDGILPYRRIPLFPLYPGKILGTPLGYSPLFDLIPLQDALNGLYSSAVSNNDAFGTQNILVPDGCNLDASQLAGNLNVLTYNKQAGEPSPLQLTRTPPELYNLIDRLIKDMEIISSINAAARGNPDPNLRSGTAMALVQTNAIQFMSGLQRQYIFLIENVGMCLIEMLQDFANSPRIATIMGKSGRSYLKQFKGSDLRAVNRVVVDVANPLTKQLSGRVQMADNLLQYGQLTPAQYISIIHTGKLETGTEPVMDKSFLIKGENEAFIEGKQCPVLITDHHQDHITEHLTVLNDPIVREDAELVGIVLDHINQHKQLWQNADPATLMASGQQPLPQMQPPMGPPGQQPPPGAEANAQAPEKMQAPQEMPPQQQALQGQGASLQAPRLPDVGGPLTMEENFQNSK